jgi:hypothetical protein
MTLMKGTTMKGTTVIAAVLLVFRTSSFAADTWGRILGTIKDQTGNPIPHAIASLANQATGVKQTTEGDG